jgi:hypothetical protein
MHRQAAALTSGPVEHIGAQWSTPKMHFPFATTQPRFTYEPGVFFAAASGLEGMVEK